MGQVLFGDSANGKVSRKQKAESEREGSDGDSSENWYASLDRLVSRVVPPKKRGRRGTVKPFLLDAKRMKDRSKSVVFGKDETTKPLKDVASDIVSIEFLNSDQSFYSFFVLVFSSFETALELYSQRKGIDPGKIRFVYKGGNVMRIVATQFINQLPGKARQTLFGEYAQFFKRSDSDFSITIDPGIENYEEVFGQVSSLSYLLQDMIRSEIDRGLENFFDFFLFSERHQKRILAKYLEKFNQLEGFENSFRGLGVADVFVFEGRGKRTDPDRAPAAGSKDDTTIRFDRPNEDPLTPDRKVFLAPIPRQTKGSQKSLMTITHNDSLDFFTNDFRARFNLTRTKINFFLLPKGKTAANVVGPLGDVQQDSGAGGLLKVRGELIDVSVPHREDDSYRWLAERANRWSGDKKKNTKKSAAAVDVLKDYTLKFEKGLCFLVGAKETVGSPSECVFTFKSLSVKTLARDVSIVLFNQQTFPWGDPKYQKRLNRLFLFVFVDIFIVFKGDRTNLLSQLRQISGALVTLGAGKKRVALQSIAKSSVRRRVAKFRRDFSKFDLIVKEFLQDVLNLVDKITTNSEKIQFRAFAKTFAQNVTLLEKTNSELLRFCSDNARIDPSQVYNLDVSDFV